MQRYQVNYRLLTGLAVGVLTAAPAIYGLWWFQVNRNATRLLAQADAAEAEGDPRLVFENLSQYVRLRRSEDDAQRRLGHASVELFKVKDLEVQERSEAYFALIEAVERTDDDKLRRELVDIHMAAGYLDRAIDAIDALVEAGKGDAKLLALKAKCLYYTQRGADATQLSYELIGYDPKTKTFDESKGRAPHEAEVYLDLARYLLSTNQRDFATEVANQLVKVNPESREAFLFQYQLHKALGEKEAARTALDQAFKLDPHDAGVLQAMGQERIADYQTAMAEANDAGDEAGDAEARRAAADKFLDEAGQFFSEGMERYPENINFYEHTARIAMYRERADEALRIAEQGLKKFDMKAA
ncbi:MAG TPA: hypothetical protein VEQ85_12405, partial [Lacipirellulaceae bacterium]|nr:hypothetical protein [Lacipirellulaceae bacterium]